MSNHEMYKSILADAERDLAAARQKVVELQAVITFCKGKMGLNGNVDTAKDALCDPVPDNLCGKKLPAAMEIVFRGIDRSMHVSEIAKKLRQGGFTGGGENLPISISTTARRRKDLFEKAGRAMFKLKGRNRKT